MNKTTIKKTVTTYLKIRSNFLIYDEKYIRIRKKVGGGLLGCFHCGNKPPMEDKIGLLITDKGNKITCSRYSKEIESEGVQKV